METNSGNKSNKGLIIFLSVLAGLLVVGIVTFIVIFNLPSNRLSRALDLGQKYLDDEKYDEAIVCFDKAIDIDPKCEEAYIGKANAYILLAEEAIDDDEYDEAVKYYEKALKTLSKGYDKTESDDIDKLILKVEKLEKKADEKINGISGDDLEEAEDDIAEIEDVEAIEEVAEEITDKSIFAPYIHEITKLSYSHKYYYWQFGYQESFYSYELDGENAMIALTDLTYDGIPEMLVASAYEYNATEAYLDIYTLDESGDVKNISSTFLDTPNYYNGYILFKCNDDDNLYKLVITADGNDLYKFELNGNNNLEAVFMNGYGDRLDNMSEILMYNAAANDYIDNNCSNVPFNGLTRGQALREIMVIDNPEEGFMPFYGVLTLTFSSGAGGWGTTISINEDGSFEGGYLDGDMGVTGPGYENGTCYIADFTGRFVNIRRINEYTYAMDLEYCNTLQEPGDEWIENEIMYIASEPYGMEGGSTFYLYLPGTDVGYLPTEFVEWIEMPSASILHELSCWGLYNVDMQYGFGSY